MACLICRNLERTLDFRRSKYFEARSVAYYQVSKELAAHKNVDMERAKSNLEEYRSACASAARARQSRASAHRQASTLVNGSMSVIAIFQQLPHWAWGTMAKVTLPLETLPIHFVGLREAGRKSWQRDGCSSGTGD